MTSSILTKDISHEAPKPSLPLLAIYIGNKDLNRAFVVAFNVTRPPTNITQLWSLRTSATIAALIDFSKALDINSAFPCLSWCFGSIQRSNCLQRSDDGTRWLLCISAVDLKKPTTGADIAITFDDVSKQLTRLDDKVTLVGRNLDKVTLPLASQRKSSTGDSDQGNRCDSHSQSRRSTSASLYRCGNFVK